MFATIVILFFAKILWNIAIAYDVYYRFHKTRKETKKISFMPEVEFILYVVAIIMSFFASDLFWLQTPKQVAIIGILIILASYMHFFLVGASSAFIAFLIKKNGK